MASVALQLNKYLKKLILCHNDISCKTKILSFNSLKTLYQGKKLAFLILVRR